MDEYTPVRYRKTNFPFHISNLCEEDKTHLFDITDQIKLAIKDEPIVNLEELDIDTFKKYGKITKDDLNKLLY